MTSKQPKKSVKKNTPNKKASAKKAPVKKTSTTKKAVINRPEDAARLLASVDETKKHFVSADKLMKTLSQEPSLVRVNDVKSPSIRKRMLAWFKILK